MADENHIHHYFAPRVGWIELQVSEKGVRSIAYISPPESPKTSRSNFIVDQLVKELDEYFGGKRKTFSLPLDPADGTPFQRQVWERLTEIPFGETRSYAQVAAATGNPRAARAVGSANKRNQIPILIPCHRVVHADGSLGGYNSGTHIKKALLELEGVSLSAEN
ncbi:MAG: methylated-DNA--[protein]-cysteine S-methyltransferase [Deltaproteobacteria bacterium]